MKPYRVLVVEDFLMSRQLFENIVNSAEDFELAGSLSSADEAVNYVGKRYVDLVIMDIVMNSGQSGLSAAKRIKDIRPETKMLIVTSMPEITYIDKARRIGAESFWYKDIQEQPILEIMRRTMKGESVYPDSTPVIKLGNAVSTEFTEKEAEVLRELTDGASNREIAEKLGISERTVKMHISNMIQKTGFRSRLELAVKARTGGLVIPE
ncbi:MAG: response regulator transcription factor [Lachnospiraceae bacterium]|nr:response regulator transcription factor [Lachnospiraceae bacterium]